MPAYESTEEYLNSTQIGRQIIRIRENVSDALTAIGNKGVTVPSGSNSDDLADLIGSIQTGGGTPSVTSHTIYFEFSDGTDTTIAAYYDSSFISDAIRATTPTEYGGKTVDSASLDGVAWYTRPAGAWETIYDGDGNLEAATPYPYFWISDLADVVIPQNSVWRITFDGTEYICTATQTIESYGYTIGNPLYSDGADDGSGVPLNLYRSPWGAWSGGADASAGSHTLKVERQVLT